MTKKYLIRTFGCQMNEHDSERIAGLLSDDDMEPTTSLDDADIVLLNTCCIRENADNKLYGTLGHLKSLKDERPDLQIAVAGCLAQKDGDLVREKAPYVDVVFGTHNVNRAAELLQHASVNGPITEILSETEEFPSVLPVQRDVPYSAWVTIQIGCDNNCAFCIVPAVRGKEMSRPFGEIVDEVRALADAGVIEVTLLGQNVNSYGRDLAMRYREASAADSVWYTGEAWLQNGRRARPLFSDLLRAVGSVPGIERVRFTSPHPKDMRTETFEAMAEIPSVCEFLHFPLQSGSDTILSAMHRGYTGTRYMEKLREARSIIPDLALSTDIIVGFPGETDTDFERTLEIAAEAEFDNAFTFEFSARSGTEAAEMSELFVPQEIVSERFARLHQVVDRSALKKHEEREGLTEEVIVEGPSRRDASVYSGRTRQNKLVHFPVTQPLREGSRCLVKIHHGAPHHLLGDFVSVVAPARHRLRIPVTASA